MTRIPSSPMAHLHLVTALSVAVASGACTPPNETERAGEYRGTAISSSRSTVSPSPANFIADPGLGFATDSVIVRFRTNTGLAAVAQRASVLARVKGGFEDQNRDGIYDFFTGIDKSGSLAKIDLDPSTSVTAALAILRQDPAVIYAEPNYLLHTADAPDDLRFGELYGLNNQGQTGGLVDADIDALEAWTTTTGDRDIVVGVVDTGIDYDHPDLAANMWTNPAETAGNGIDDDGNGVIDDLHGFNAITRSGDPFDDNRHGTHCAGTIGAVGGNGVGIVGVNWKVSLMALKFLSSAGRGTTADAVAAISYALQQKNAGVNLRVLSNSWGGGAESRALRDTIAAAEAADILFVASAGNARVDLDQEVSYPASYDVANVLAVAATDHVDGLAEFSNYGTASVDMAAPGVRILSTTPGDTYSLLSGTSMAAPHVAGAAALLLAANSSLTTEQIKALLMDSSDRVPALAGKMVAGRLNVATAIAAAGSATPQFRLLEAVPSARIINQGDTATFAIDVRSAAGFTDEMTLSVTSVPPMQAAVAMTPQTISGSGTASLTVATSDATAVASYTLTITATSGALTRSRHVTLRVRPRGTVDFEVVGPNTPLELDRVPDPEYFTPATVDVRRFLTISEVVVDVTFTVRYPELMEVRLVSPSGKEVVALDRGSARSQPGNRGTVVATLVLPNQFSSEEAFGTWTLRTTEFRNTTTLIDWRLRFSGHISRASFDIQPGQTEQTVYQGGTASFPINIPAFGVFPGAVTLDVITPPALTADVALSTTSVTVPGSSVLRVATDCNTAPGRYQLPINGAGGTMGFSSPVQLTVYPFGARSLALSSRNTPLPIPNNDPLGLTDTITVEEDLTVAELYADISVLHRAPTDLQVQIISPSGEIINVPDPRHLARYNGSFRLDGFAGVASKGVWRIKASDDVDNYQRGNLVGWTLRMVAAPKAIAPRPAFTHQVDGDQVSFTDQSDDPGCDLGTLTSWAWDFGDGSSSTEREPIHRYQVASTYQVTLTVTDAEGLTASATQAVTSGVASRDDGAGGCATSEGTRSWPLAALLLAWLTRRRRRQASGRGSWHGRFALAAVIIATGCGDSERAHPAGETHRSAVTTPAVSHTAQYAPYAADSVIVRFKPSASSVQRRQGALAKVHGGLRDHNRDGTDDRFAHLGANGELAKIDLRTSSLSVAAALDILRADPDVEYAEPNYLIELFATPRDPRFAELYGLHNTGQAGGRRDADIDAFEAWDRTTGSRQIVVGVIDSGIDYTHSDLAANMWRNPKEIAGNQIDDDGNGIVDDIHGLNSYAGSGNPMDDGYDDTFLGGHGTHGAGVVGAVGDNGLGVVGVNWNTSLMALKFINEFGAGTYADAVAAIDYAIAQKRAGVNLRVLTASWGAFGYSRALYDAIAAAHDAGILLVTGAGNTGSDNEINPVYPGSYDLPNVLSVAATDYRDERWGQSNYGATSVDLGAPGTAVLSTVPGNGYALESGTSMAAMMVAGAAALVLSANDSLTSEELKDVLMSSGDLKPSLTGVTVSGRRLNVAAAVAAADALLPRFLLRATSHPQPVSQQQATSFGFEVVAQAGFGGQVAVAVTSSPPINATIAVSPAIPAGVGTGTVTVTTTSATVPGTYTVSINASAGALTRSRPVTLRVLPQGAVSPIFHSVDTPRSIPDRSGRTFTSVIDVHQEITISEAHIELKLNHAAPAALRITLTSAAGTVVVLQARGSLDSSQPEVTRVYSLSVPLLGQQAAGSWTMTIEDLTSAQYGTLESWTLSLLGTGGADSFAITAAPVTTQVRQGESTSIAVSTSPFGSFPGLIALAAATESAQLRGASVTPATTSAPGAASVEISADCGTAVGDHVLTITGRSGELIRTARAAITVQPFASRSWRLSSTETPVSIPGNEKPAIATIEIAEDLVISNLIVDVNVLHSQINSLEVVLVGPEGQRVMLHSHANGRGFKLARSFTIDGFVGLNSKGIWQLQAIDTTGVATGRITDFSLRLTASPRYLAPTAEFVYDASKTDIAFTDTSRDQGCDQGSLSSWLWDFGDGSVSTERNPTHRYADSGTYTVTLTVGNDGELSAVTSQQVAARGDDDNGGCSTAAVGAPWWLGLMLCFTLRPRRRSRASPGQHPG